MIILEKFKENDTSFVRINDKASLWSFTLSEKNTTIAQLLERARHACNELGLKPVEPVEIDLVGDE